MVLSLGEYSRVIDGSLYVLSSDKKSVIKLNESGQFLWKKMKGQHPTKKALASSLAKKFRISQKKALADVEQFMKMLSDLSRVINTP